MSQLTTELVQFNKIKSNHLMMLPCLEAPEPHNLTQTTSFQF